MLLVIAVLAGWALLSVPLALGCGRAFAAGNERPMPTAAATDYTLVA